MAGAGEVARVDEKAIDALFRSIDQCHLPGAAVGIAIRGMPVYRKGFGLASLDAPLVLTTSTRLRIGSVTKQFTCLACMLLCEEGRAQADDPIGKYLPELHPASRGATLRQVMAHTSGLRDAYTAFFQFNDARGHAAGPSQRVESADFLEMYRHIDDVEAPAGTAWNYSNGTYLLLSVAIERIAGKSYEEFLAERIFAPIGMNDTLVMRSDTPFIPRRGSQHVVNPAGGYERISWGVDNFLGAGAMISTVDDLLRWLAHMDAPRVGSPATWAAMRASATLDSGVPTGYGLGLILDRYRGVSAISHAGGAFGGNAHVMKVPSAQLDIVVLVNRQDVYGPSLAERIVDACVHGLNPARDPEATAATASGTFHARRSGRVVQLSGHDGKQLVAIDGGVNLPFEADASGVLHYPSEEASRHKVTPFGPADAPTAVRLDSLGVIEDLVRVEAPSATDATRITGRYRSTGMRTDATIERRPEGLVLVTAGLYGSVDYGLECLSNGIWRGSRLGMTRGVGIPTAILCFGEDGRTFRYSGGPLRAVRFERCD